MQNFYSSPATQYSSTCYVPSDIQLFLNGFFLACQILHSLWGSSFSMGVLPFLTPNHGKFGDVFMASRSGVAQYFRIGTKRKTPNTLGVSWLKIPIFICFFPLNLDSWCPQELQAPQNSWNSNHRLCLTLYQPGFVHPALMKVAMKSLEQATGQSCMDNDTLSWWTSQ